MALQSSGAIKISEIKAELGSSNNSLRALSNIAGFSTPDAMSEFYGYSSSGAPPSGAIDYFINISHSVSNVVANFWSGVVTYTIESTITSVNGSSTGNPEVEPPGLYLTYNYTHRGVGYYGPFPTQTTTVNVNNTSIFELNSSVAFQQTGFYATRAELRSANTEIVYAPENYNITIIDN
jgi:hypothetical protein